MARRLQRPAELALAVVATCALAASSSACAGPSGLGRSDPRSQTTLTSATLPLGDDEAVEADRTQGDDPDDRRITREIRAALHDDESLSPRARNTRVTTNGRRVLLTGVVPSESERQQVEIIARRHAVDVENGVQVAGASR